MRRTMALVPVLVALAACTREGRSVGADCVRNSDCRNGLVCTFERCHKECVEARDCTDGALCVIGEHGSLACLLPDEESCVYETDCDPPLVCGRDLKCRNACQGDEDCATRTQLCVASDEAMVCAEPEQLIAGELLKPRIVGSIDAEVDAVVPPEDDGGAAPDAMTLDGGSQSDAAAMDATAMDATMVEDADAAPEPDAASEAGTDPTPDSEAGSVLAPETGADAGTAAVVTEQEPNDMPGLATPYQIGSSVRGSIEPVTDVDYYEVSVPAGDAAGGYFLGSVDDIVGGTVSVAISDASSHSPVGSFDWITPPARFFWAGAAGEVYRVKVTKYSGNATYSYSFRLDYLEVQDAFEPNSRDTSAGITLGTSIDAAFYAGFSDDAPVPESYLDWYVIEPPLSVGKLTVQLENVASNIRPLVTLYGPNNMISRSGSMGTDFLEEFSIATAGTYRIAVGVNGALPSFSGSNHVAPDHFKRPYRLTVSQ